MISALHHILALSDETTSPFLEKYVCTNSYLPYHRTHRRMGGAGREFQALDDVAGQLKHFPNCTPQTPHATGADRTNEMCQDVFELLVKLGLTQRNTCAFL